MKKLNPEFKTLSPEQRLYQLTKPVIALTGGIATGKSTVAKLLDKKGLVIIDADALVKQIYQTEDAKDFIRKHVPAAWTGTTIDFKVLRERVFSDGNMKAAIENFIYAKLPEFFQAEAGKITDQGFIIYDVPLLFEKKIDRQVDLKIVVYAPRTLQLSRLLARDGTNLETAEKILASQLDIELKKQKADFIIDNSGSLEDLEKATTKVSSMLMST